MWYINQPYMLLVHIISKENSFHFKLSSCILNFKFKFCATTTTHTNTHNTFVKSTTTAHTTLTKYKRRRIFNQYVSLSYHACIILILGFCTMGSTFKVKIWCCVVTLLTKKYTFIFILLLFIVFEIRIRDVCICKNYPVM